MHATIYRVDSGYRNVCDGLTVNRPNSDAIYTESLYDLPEGFRVDVDSYGVLRILDQDGIEVTPCLVNNSPRSAVCLICRDGRSITIRKAKSQVKHIPLRDARISAGLTQQQLAKLSGVNSRQIQRVELGEADAGNLTAKNLLSIADALGVDPRSLVTD